MSNHSRRLKTVRRKLFIHCGDDPNETQDGERDHDKVAFNITINRKGSETDKSAVGTNKVLDYKKANPRKPESRQ